MTAASADDGRDALQELPVVSVVIPMLDELGFIEPCLDSFDAQDYPHDLLDVIVVDGGSTDGSRDYVDRRAESAGWLRVVENPDRRAASAFNRGLEAARGTVICLFSAHGVAGSDYLSESVAVLQATDAVGVGGRLEHEGSSRASRAIGLAMMSPVGMASPFRYADERREVDTIGHPAYLRQALLDIGGFDEGLERNSDYELNWRLREAGDRLMFEPAIVTRYRPRDTLDGLARQFWWYGRWKERVIRRHPRSLRARHLVPPLAVVLLGAAPLAALSRRGRAALTVIAGTYGALVLVGVASACPREEDADPLVLAACFPIMHGAWGAGFLASLAEDLLADPRRPPMRVRHSSRLAPGRSKG
jgi:glycosyltransferase involved in cell wall biosynthesis